MRTEGHSGRPSTGTRADVGRPRQTQGTAGHRRAYGCELIHPCKHEACSKCVETAGNTATCYGCPETVAFLACPGSRHGCQFDTTKGSWKDHLSKCFFLPLECPNRCGMAVLRKQLLSHLATDCQLRLTGCQFCGETLFELEVGDHENSCPKAPVSCPYCLREGLKREEMVQHAKGCSKTPKPCPLREYGCDFSGVDEDIDRHLTVRNHVVCFREMKKSQRECQLEMEKLRSELYSCKSDFEACKSQLDSCKNELAELSNGGGAIIFDKEIQWVFQSPRAISDCLCSPLYRHRGSGAVVYFRLSCSQQSQGGRPPTLSRGGSVYVTLDWYQMQAGKATSASTFTVIMYSLEDLAQYMGYCGMNASLAPYGPPAMKAKTEIAKKVGTGSCDRMLFQATVTVGNQYVISYKQGN